MRRAPSPQRGHPTFIPWVVLATGFLLALPVVLGAAHEIAPSSDTVTTPRELKMALDDRLVPPRSRPVAGDRDEGPGHPEPLSSPEVHRQPQVVDREPTPMLARVEGLRLVRPTATPVAVGFHEAATHRAKPLRPIGQMATNRNGTRFTSVGDTMAGRSYAVLHSRGRAAEPTSAIDVAMRDDDPVLAPVSGRVVSVLPYLLEGRYDDLRIAIQPDAAPQLRVIVIHVDDVVVEPGDRVSAGETVVAATARRLPFFSQIDELTAPDRWPHVHIEVQPEPPPEPEDPDEPDGAEEDGPDSLRVRSLAATGSSR